MAEIGRSFTARSGDESTGERVLLPTNRGYVYFRMDRPQDVETLFALRDVQARFWQRLGSTEAEAQIKLVGRLPLASKIALITLITAIAAAVWYFYSKVLPTL